MSSETATDTIQNFSMMFPDEDSCREHLYRLRWPSGFRCPICGHHDFYYIQSRHLYECRKCRHQTSLTAGTVMHRTKLPLKTWFHAIHLLARSEYRHSVMYIRDIIGVSYPTAWALCSKIRSAMREQDADIKLAGIIQMKIDSFGARPLKGFEKRYTVKLFQGHVAMSLDSEGNPVQLVVRLADESGADAFSQFIRKYVEPESTPEALSQITTSIAPKSNPYRATLTTENLIGKTIRQMKSFITDRYKGYSKKQLQNCLDDFSYRFNRRFQYSQIFSSVISACLNGSARTYEDLLV
jgi:transposase-like protein